MSTAKKLSVVNTELLDKFFPSSKIVGDHTFELKGFKEIVGHDDSLPFQAKLYINGKECAIVHNDGWGGETNVSPNKEEAFKIIYEAERYIKELKLPSCVCYGLQLYWDKLSYICDYLADNCSARKDITRLTKKKMVIYNPKTKRLASVSFKGLGKMSIQDAMQTAAFPTVWNNSKKKYESQGYVILNNVD